jgi:hypothetical protein
MSSVPGIYRVTAPDSTTPLRQGEILTSVIQLRVRLDTVQTANPVFNPIAQPFAVILTQDCDLEQDHQVRSAGKQSDKLLPAVLFCEVVTAQEQYGRIRQINPKFWDRIKINNDIRYHFLQKVEPGCDRLQEGLPELAIDFKRYFTLPTEEVYRRIELGEAQRRCVLVSPYLEHLSGRFASFLSRVALPEEHLSV